MKHNHYQRIKTFIQRVTLRIRLLTFLERFALLIAGMSLLLLLGLGIAPLQSFWGYAPLLYTLLGGGMVVALVVFTFSPFFLRYSPDRVALLIEEKYPWLRNNMINSLQLYPLLHSPADDPWRRSKELVRGLITQTAEQLPFLNAAHIGEKRVLHRSFLLAVMLLGTVGLVSLISPLALERSLHLLLHPGDHLPIHEMHMTVTISKQRVLVGEPVQVMVEVTGRKPEQMVIRQWEQGKSPEAAVEKSMLSTSDPGKFSYTFSRPQSSFHFQVVAGSTLSETYDIEVISPPAVGNLKMQYFYPAYTLLPSKVEEGSGHIEALVGTEVKLEMIANREMIAGKIRFDDGTQLPLHIGQNGLIQGQAVIMKSGGYTIEVTDKYGFTNPDPVHYAIVAIPDQYPQIEILQPAEEMTVDEGKPIYIDYMARDDFGLREIYLVYQTDQGEKKIALKMLSDKRTVLRGDYYWDTLGILSKEGEMVSYYLEVWDNDTISGPKKGVSRTHYLKVRGREEEHQKLQDLQEQIAESLLDLLGDQLDFTATLDSLMPESLLTPQEFQRLQQEQQAMQQRAQDILAQLDEALQRAEQDPMSTFNTFDDLHTLRQNLAFTEQNLMPAAQEALREFQQAQQNAARQSGEREAQQQTSPNTAQQTRQGSPQQNTPFSPSQTRQGSPQRADQAEETEAMRNPQERLTSELEKLALFADDIAKRSRMQDVENMAQKLLRQQNNFLDTLDKMSRLDQLDPKALQGLEKELQEIENLLRALMEALSQMPSQLPDEFVNSDALQNLEFGDMQQMLDALRQKLAEGDLEGAKQLAQELLKALSEMMAALQNAQNFAQSMPFGGQQGNMERAANELTEIAKEQEAIFKETTKHDKEFSQRINQKQQSEFEQMRVQKRKEIEQFLKQNRALWDTLEHAPDFQNRPIERRYLSRNYFQVNRELSKMLQSLSPDKVAELFGSLTPAIEGLQEMESMLDPQNYAKEQEQLRQERESLMAFRRELNDLLNLEEREIATPQERQQVDDLSEREAALRERTEKLSDKLNQLSQLVPFISPELRQNIEEAIPFMGEAREELGEISTRRALPPEREALNRLLQAQQNMQQAMQQMAQRGQIGLMPAPVILQARRDPFQFGQRPQMSRNQFDQGIMGLNNRDFKIPGKEDYQVPKTFREEIIKALREGYPQEYKQQIERYFRNLTE